MINNNDDNVEFFPPEEDPELIKQAIEEDLSMKKDEVINNLKINFNGIEFDADLVSQNRMAATGVIANYLFRKYSKYLKSTSN